MSLTKAAKHSPYHISVGAVIIDKENKILCHYYPKTGTTKNIYKLMTETVDAEESIEANISRGLMEEFGATGKTEKYIGSIVSNDTWWKTVEVQKTTLYFLVKLKSFDPTKRKAQGDQWDGSEIVRTDINELIEKMDEQFERYGIGFLNEGEILRRV